MISASATTIRKSSSPTTNGQIVGEYYPLQRNRNGGFRDLHVMQELYYTTRGGDRFSLAAWYLDSHRGLAMLTSDRNKSKQKKNTQDERTLRAVAGWERLRNGLKLGRTRGLHLHRSALPAQAGPRRQRAVRRQYRRPEPHPHALRQGRSRICARREVALLGQRRPPPAPGAQRRPLGDRQQRPAGRYALPAGAVRTFGVRRREMASRAAAGRRRRPAVGVIRRPYDARHPGAVRGLRALETAQRGRPGFGRPQLPLPHAQRPLLPPRRQQEPQTRTGLDVRRGLGNERSKATPVRCARRPRCSIRASTTGYSG